jgi:hypothetical protein
LGRRGDLISVYALEVEANTIRQMGRDFDLVRSGLNEMAQLMSRSEATLKTMREWIKGKEKPASHNANPWATVFARMMIVLWHRWTGDERDPRTDKCQKFLEAAYASIAPKALKAVEGQWKDAARDSQVDMPWVLQFDRFRNGEDGLAARVNPRFLTQKGAAKEHTPETWRKRMVEAIGLCDPMRMAEFVGEATPALAGGVVEKMIGNAIESESAASRDKVERMIMAVLDHRRVIAR